MRCVSASVGDRKTHGVGAPLRRRVEEMNQRSFHRKTVAGNPFAVDVQPPRGDAREVVRGAEPHPFGPGEVGAFGEERTDRGRQRVGYDRQVSGVRTEAVTAPSAYAPPTQASEPLRVRTASWARSCSGRGTLPRSVTSTARKRGVAGSKKR